MKSELEQRRILRNPDASDVPSELLDKLSVMADKAVKDGTKIKIIAFMVVDPEGENERMHIVRYGFVGDIDQLGWIQASSDILKKSLYAHAMITK